MIRATTEATLHRDQLQHHPDNPRLGEIDSIRASIRAHGFYGRLIVQQSTMFIIAGNHRFKAGVEEGLSEFPCRILDCDDATAKRILLADNRTQDLATYDNDKLLALVQQFTDNLAAVGFSEDEHRALTKTADYEKACEQGAVTELWNAHLDNRVGRLTIAEYVIALEPEQYEDLVARAKAEAENPDDKKSVAAVIARWLGLPDVPQGKTK